MCLFFILGQSFLTPLNQTHIDFGMSQVKRPTRSGSQDFDTYASYVYQEKALHDATTWEEGVIQFLKLKECA